GGRSLNWKTTSEAALFPAASHASTVTLLPPSDACTLSSQVFSPRGFATWPTIVTFAIFPESSVTRTTPFTGFPLSIWFALAERISTTGGVVSAGGGGGAEGA